MNDEELTAIETLTAHAKAGPCSNCTDTSCIRCMGDDGGAGCPCTCHEEIRIARGLFRDIALANTSALVAEVRRLRARCDAAERAAETARAEGERAFVARALASIDRAAWTLVVDGAKPSRDREMRRDGYALGALAAWRIVRDLHAGREPEDCGPTATVVDAIETARAEEREACAARLEGIAARITHQGYAAVAVQMAQEIRARGGDRG